MAKDSLQTKDSLKTRLQKLEEALARANGDLTDEELKKRREAQKARIKAQKERQKAR